MKEQIAKLRTLLSEAVRAAGADGILFSGGLDTSVLAYLGAQLGPLKAVTICLSDEPAPDERYARLLAAKLGLQHMLYRTTKRELLRLMPETIKILRTFDPMELRNSVVVYLGLLRAKEAGISTVLTGDAADELFAGYSYMFNMAAEELERYLPHLASHMSFSAPLLGEAIGIKVAIPYLTSQVKEFALSLDMAALVGEPKGQRLGKLILRRAFEDDLPPEIVWRVKTPIEFGSGSTGLTRYLEEWISNQQFEKKQARYLERDQVRIRDKEQLFYYEMYRDIFGPPRMQQFSGSRCPHCQAPLRMPQSRFCHTCGAYPVQAT